MIDSQQKQEILDSISSHGGAESKPILLNTNLEHILSRSSGSPRIQSTVLRKSNLILSKPESLHSLSALQIRCCLCKRVISYPCWYYEVKYAVNHFHYFICFSSESKEKPLTKCYRKG
jgi:hypothetical protein